MPSRSGWLRSVAVVMAGALLVVAGGRHALALALARDPDHAARALALGTPVAEARLQSALQADTPAMQQLHARRALQLRPLDGRAYRTLAALATGDGQAGLYRAAMERAPRDVPARAWLADDALRAQRPREAVAHVVALLDSRTDVYDRLFPLLAAWSHAPQARDAVVDAVARPSAWRAGFLAWWLRQPRSRRAGFPAILEALQSRGALEWDQRHALAVQLREAGEPLAATLLEATATNTARIADPAFHRVADPAGPWAGTERAGWSVQPLSSGPGVEIRAQARADATGLEQALLLPAGVYGLAARSRRVDGPSQVALSWQLTCGQGHVIAQVDLSPASDWRVGSAVARVPADCNGPRVALVSAAARFGPPVRYEIASVRLVPAGSVLPQAPEAPRGALAVAWVDAGSGVSVIRNGRRRLLEPGSLVLANDQALRAAGAGARLAWLGGCRARVAAMERALPAPCPLATAPAVMAPVQPRLVGHRLPPLPTFAP